MNTQNSCEKLARREFVKLFRILFVLLTRTLLYNFSKSLTFLLNRNYGKYNNLIYLFKYNLSSFSSDTKDVEIYPRKECRRRRNRRSDDTSV
jgi:hypothetical protein